MSYLWCLVPPLAIWRSGKRSHLIISVLLTLCMYIPGMIHAVLVVNTYKADKRNERLTSSVRISEN